ncbi:MAG: DUF5131 family protein [Planctomycetes bacterium]|nr:DUF5131 family protein [Planctomycetota bacterium]
MGDKTLIQWCDSTVNPVMGCAGCELLDVCYASEWHDGRLAGASPYYAPQFNVPTLFPGRTAKMAGEPDLRGRPRPKKPWLDGMPRMIFVSDMGDALSEGRYLHRDDLEGFPVGQGKTHFKPGDDKIMTGGVPFEFLEEEIMDMATSSRGRRHIWLWLTKRPERMAEFAEWRGKPWPPNVWPGTSITSTKTLWRLDALSEVGDASTRRFLSIEPLWEEISISGHFMLGNWWVIVGGESSQKARPAKPFDLAWARKLRDECRALEIPFFLKQLGGAPVENGEPYRLRLKPAHGGAWEEWPEDLRVREMPS